MEQKYIQQGLLDHPTMEFTTKLKRSQQVFACTKSGNAHATNVKKLHNTSQKKIMSFKQHACYTLNISLHNNNSVMQLFIV